MNNLYEGKVEETDKQVLSNDNWYFSWRKKAPEYTKEIVLKVEQSIFCTFFISQTNYFGENYSNTTLAWKMENLYFVDKLPNFPQVRTIRN